jgi:hypothetical protein
MVASGGAFMEANIGRGLRFVGHQRGCYMHGNGRCGAGSRRYAELHWHKWISTDACAGGERGHAAR